MMWSETIRLMQLWKCNVWLFFPLLSHILLTQRKRINSFMCWLGYQQKYVCFYKNQSITGHFSYLQESHSDFSTISGLKALRCFLGTKQVFSRYTIYGFPRYKSKSSALMGKEILILGTHGWYIVSELEQLRSYNREPTNSKVVCVLHLLTVLHFPDSTSCPWSGKQRWNEVSSPVCPRANSWYAMIFHPNLCPSWSFPFPRISLDSVIFSKVKPSADLLT